MTTDLNFWRSSVTVISLLLFLALMARTWSRKRRAGFDDAAQLPFLDEAPEQERGAATVEPT
ncbi:MAG TPA: cbb3-type cytochrome c oxidase subunit 3 [Ideonella sp.]|nr:cbb3-type cytochrome c oxidase subunit 3 [Ideonella sp.]